jgi:ABC-type Fe3+-hydroxamate transport system substrate-binding protein
MTRLVDAIGTEHAPLADGAAPRIVSLVPSVTELLCDLGLARHIVGRTGFCIHPAAIVPGIPKVGGTKDVNIDKIRRLAPTHLIVNIDENEKPTVARLAEFIPHVVVTHPLGPLDNPPLFRLLGGIFGAQEQAERLCLDFAREWDALQALPPPPPRMVLYCIWKDPWMTVSQDTYIARMLEAIGWRQWKSEADAARYPSFSWSEALVRGIDGVLLSSEPYRFAQTHADALESQIGKPVLLVDGEMLSWYGSRSILGLAYLRRLAQEQAL